MEDKNHHSQKNPTKVLVGLSWWVDSAVSAYLLKEAGYDVSCGFMINYLEDESLRPLGTPLVKGGQGGYCPTRIDLEEARKVAEFLNLPFYTFDYREEYEKRIVEYIYREYDAGRTPNPDVFCNNLVKFDLFLEEALSLGFDAIATGHYARIIENWELRIENERAEKNYQLSTINYQLLKWVDPNKDQSYFLSRLSEFQLEKAIFPIWHLMKSEVREIAKKVGLPNAERKDSQWLCFIGKVSMKEFLERRLPKKPGNILNIHGKIIGEHEWAFSYTIGQRKGIKVGGGQALFVIAKDTRANTITVGNEDELSLYKNECILVEWSGEIPEAWKKYWVKIRYRQEDQNGEFIVDSWQLTVRFEVVQRAITPGQICVVYDEDRVLGSGIIV